MDWLPRHDGIIRRGVAAKKPMRAIAEMIGPNVNRNMVIGRYHRICGTEFPCDLLAQGAIALRKLQREQDDTIAIAALTQLFKRSSSRKSFIINALYADFNSRHIARVAECTRSYVSLLNRQSRARRVAA